MSTTDDSYSLTLWTYRARVVEIVDGDTYDLEIDLGMHVTVRARVRLDGLNTRKRGTAPGNAAILFAQEYLGKALDPRWPIIVRTRKDDKAEKFGRLLARIWSADPSGSLNSELLRAGLAAPYDGKTPHED